MPKTADPRETDPCQPMEMRELSVSQPERQREAGSSVSMFQVLSRKPGTTLTAAASEWTAEEPREAVKATTELPRETREEGIVER